MSLILILSILIRLSALILSLILIHRIRDWRMGVLSVMVGLMAVRQILTLLETRSSWTPTFQENFSELPGLAVSILILLVIFSLQSLLSDRRSAQTRLEESREQQAALLSQIPGMAYRRRPDPSWTMDYISRGCEALTGWSSDELTENPARAFVNLIHPEDRSRLNDDIPRNLINETSCRNEYRIITASGTEKWVLDQARGKYSDSGELVAVEGLITDITDRKETEDTLRKSEERFRLLMQHIPDVVMSLDREGIIRFINFTLPEYTVEGVMGTSVYTYLSPDDARRYRIALEKVFTCGEARPFEIGSVGPRRWYVRLIPIRKSPAVESALVIATDVTEHRQMEEQLRHLQKLEAIGQLAGGVAHEFNNLLTAIIGNLHLASEGTPPDSDQGSSLAIAERAAQRAIALTSQLLTFSRRNPICLEPVDIHAVASEVIRLLRQTFDRKIRVSIETMKGLRPILGDNGQIQQVVMNLCVNARDALMERLGSEPARDGPEDWTPHLWVRTKNLHLGELEIQNTPEARCGEAVCIEISDNGTGIPEEIRYRIFEPFFTTKGPGHGTGLGLAAVHGVVKQHNGWIVLTSKEGIGTTFQIFFPPTDARIPEKPTKSPTHGRVQGTETILFVDDEEPIRRLGRTILEKHGYKVLLAKDGMEAIERYKREADHIRLVVLDLTMPLRSGQEVLHRLHEINPRLKVVISSGHHPKDWDTENWRREYIAFIPKPYRSDDLLRCVRNHLDRPVAGEAAPPR